MTAIITVSQMIKHQVMVGICLCKADLWYFVILYSCTAKLLNTTLNVEYIKEKGL